MVLTSGSPNVSHEPADAKPQASPEDGSFFTDAIVDGMTSGVVVIDRDYRIRRTNAYLERWLKRDRQQLVGQHCFQLIHKRDSPCSDCPCTTTFRTGKPSSVVHTGFDGEGGTTHAEIVSLPIRDESGEVTWAVEVAQDVSERVRFVDQLNGAVTSLKASEEQLKRRNDELEVLNTLLTRTSRSLSLDDVLEGALAATLRLVARPAWGEIFLMDESGRRMRRAAQRGLDEAVVVEHDQGLAVADCLGVSAARTGKVVLGNCSADGCCRLGAHSRGAQHLAVPLISRERVLGILFLSPPESGQLTAERERLFEMIGRQIGIAVENTLLYQRTDAALHGKIAELTRALASVEQERARALASERSKDDFVAMVSHDLRSPLSVIVGETSSFGRRCDNPDCREGRELTFHAARRMTAMLNDLVDSARLESGKLALQRERLELDELIGELVSKGFSSQDRARLRLVETPSSAPIEGDRSWLERAVTNVVSNALKFAPRDTPVELGLSADLRSARLVIRDHGPGIPAAELPMLFERFFRASNSERIHGSGLGLYITRQVIEAHGGTVGVASELGKGVTVTMSLPLTRK